MRMKTRTKRANLMKNKSIVTCDFGSTREYTPEGFLKVKVLAGKVGVQRYTCDETDMPDIHGTGYVFIARLPEQVFDNKSLDSMAFIDVTDNHPPEREVNAENYKARSVGVVTSVGKVSEDGVHIETTAIIKDKAAIKVVESNKKQLSLGYNHGITEKSGSLDGVDYDGYQTNIDYNHLSIVHNGRAKTTMILDSEDLSMTEAEIAAMQLENKTLKASNSQLTTDNETLTNSNKKLSNDAEEIKVLNTAEKAQKIDPKFDTKGKKSEEIMRGVLGNKVSTDHAIDIVEYAFEQAHKAASTPERAPHRDISFGKKSNDGEDDTHDKRYDNEEIY